MFFNKAKKTMSLLLTLAMIFTMLASVSITPVSAEALVEAEVAIANKATGIKVDGQISEGAWLSATWYDVAARQVATTLNNTVSFATVWNNSTLYFAAKVIDSTIVSENLNESIYNNDGMEIFIEPTNSKETDLYNPKTAHFMYQVGDGKWDIWGGAGKWSSILSEMPSAQAKHALTEDGYTLEFSISFADLGLTGVADGTVLGLEVNNNDDDNAASADATDRGSLFWDGGMSAGDPSSWGNVLLSNGNVKPIISYAGTPEFDGKIDSGEGWTFTTEKMNDGAGLGYKIGSMCDDKNFYIGFVAKGEGLDESSVSFFLDLANTKGTKDVTLLQFVDFMPSLNEADYIRKGVEGAFSYDCAEALGAKTNDGYTVELKIPLTLFDEKPAYLDTVGMEVDFFKVKGDYGNGRTRWSNASEDSMWSASSSYGSILLNNLLVGGGKNNAPTGNQISTYSIAQGEKISDKLTITDPDEGDTLTFKLDPAMEVPGSDKGTFKLDEKTGEWAYSTPDASFLAKDGVSYFILAEDSNGAIFRQRVEIRVEPKATNLTYHVDGDNGSDMNDGLSKAQAFKTINAAAKIVNPGDTVLVYKSSTPYNFAEKRTLTIDRGGLPDAYITFKAAPGEKPVINGNGVWNTVDIKAAYIKFEGFTVAGIAKDFTFEERYNAFKGDPDGHYNTNGIVVSACGGGNIERGGGVSQVRLVHHVEVRDCLMEYLSAAGVCTTGSDYITIENNTIVNNCWSNQYASSGISVLGTVDIDTKYDEHKIIVRNNICGGQRHFVPWKSLARFSDGNGIIIDSTNNNSGNANMLAAGDLWGVTPYEGRILVANNLCFLNGGSGIHAFDADHTDMINNTIYFNSSTPVLGYSDFYASQADDINMYNNIVYSRTGKKMTISSSANTSVNYDNNLFFNYNEGDNNLGKNITGKAGKAGTTAGANNIYGQDPLFVNVYEVDHKNNTPYPAHWTEEMLSFAEQSGYYMDADYSVPTDYDFSLASNSPALNAGNKEWSDLVGNTENRLGVFGTIGSSLRPMTIGIGGEGTPSTPADEITVMLDGAKVVFPDVKPFLYQDRTLVPFRAIFEAMGATVGWEEATETVTGNLGDKSVVLQINNKIATANGQQIELDVPAMLHEDRTMVPLRFIAESLGAIVDWVDATQTVIITTK